MSLVECIISQYKVVTVVVTLIILCTSSPTDKRNKYYSVGSFCSHNYNLPYYRIGGAVIEAKNETNLDCIFTFMTDSILENFMIRFDFLQLDCGDHLYVFDGAHTVGSYLADLTCTNSNKTIKVIYTRTNYVTFKYVTDYWTNDSNGFKFIITAVKDTKFSCEGFRCKQSEFCISKDLVSDGVNHCQDGSDETQSKNTTAIREIAGIMFRKFKEYLIEQLLNDE